MTYKPKYFIKNTTSTTKISESGIVGDAMQMSGPGASRKVCNYCGLVFKTSRIVSDSFVDVVMGLLRQDSPCVSSRGMKDFVDRGTARVIRGITTMP